MRNRCVTFVTRSIARRLRFALIRDPNMRRLRRRKQATGWISCNTVPGRFSVRPPAAPPAHLHAPYHIPIVELGATGRAARTKLRAHHKLLIRLEAMADHTRAALPTGAIGCMLNPLMATCSGAGWHTLRMGRAGRQRHRRSRRTGIGTGRIVLDARQQGTLIPQSWHNEPPQGNETEFSEASWLPPSYASQFPVARWLAEITQRRLRRRNKPQISCSLTWLWRCPRCWLGGCSQH